MPILEVEAEDRYLSSAQLKARYGGVSDMWIRRRQQDDPDFPDPMDVEGRRFWKMSELLKWERLRAAGRPAKEPARRHGKMNNQ